MKTKPITPSCVFIKKTNGHSSLYGLFYTLVDNFGASSLYFLLMNTARSITIFVSAYFSNLFSLSNCFLIYSLILHPFISPLSHTD